MSDYGLIADIGTIRFARMLQRPADEVWDYLTKPTLLAGWLAEGTIQLRVGGYVDLSFELTEGPDRAAAGLPISGVVTRCDPPESLGFSWTDANTISHVSFELERHRSQVLLLLTHADLPLRLAVACAASWHAHLDMLEARLGNAVPEPYAQCVRRVVPYYQRYREARMLTARPS
jgi:uncharacterized protein YndB with AHSA1/START domain